MTELFHMTSNFVMLSKQFCYVEQAILLQNVIQVRHFRPETLIPGNMHLVSFASLFKIQYFWGYSLNKYSLIWSSCQIMVSQCYLIFNLLAFLQSDHLLSTQCALTGYSDTVSTRSFYDIFWPPDYLFFFDRAPFEFLWALFWFLWVLFWLTSFSLSCQVSTRRRTTSERLM